MVKPKQQQRLDLLLSKQEKLKIIYDFRLRLQKIWQRPGQGAQKDLLKQLQEWCRQAEETGIEALSRFAGQVKMLSVA